MNRTLYRLHSTRDVTRKICLLEEILSDSVRCKGNFILGNPGADSGGEGKSKQAEKYGTKKSKERREEPLGTMSY